MHLNLQAKKDASSSLALVLIGVAAVLCAAFIPHVTTPRVASRLVEVNHPDACPPQWLPVLLASGSDREHSPAPQLDDQGLPFKGNDEALSMKQPLPPTPTPRRAMAPCLDPTAHWQCVIVCHRIAGQCTRECTAKHRVEKNKRENKKCKNRCDQAKTTCKAACIRCNETPPPVSAPGGR